MGYSRVRLMYNNNTRVKIINSNLNSNKTIQWGRMLYSITLINTTFVNQIILLLNFIKKNKKKIIQIVYYKT